MKPTTEGSILLILFIVLTIITLWVAGIWRSTIYMNNLILAKQQYERQFRLTEGMIEFGIGAAQYLYKRWEHVPVSSAVCIFPQWPPSNKGYLSDDLSAYSGKIVVRKKVQQMRVRAQLLKEDSVVMTLQSTLKFIDQNLTKTSDENLQKKMIITNWSIDEWSAHMH